ncbi:hypothetical protein [Bremerella sp.]|uniref:hypothetical protein n=1 Tax=Bremerella sp. TaxID=2795602 RepID=UPI0039193C4D
MIEAFQAIGKPDAAKAVIAAAKIVGVDVSCTDQDHDPTERLTEEQSEKLWEVEGRFEIDADEIYPALTFYALKNPQHFPKSNVNASK